MSAPPPRVRVTHSRTDAVRLPAHRPPVREIEEQTPLGEVYMSSLIRSQRRLGIAVCGAVALLLFGVAVAGRLVPSYDRTRWFGVPLPWLVLGLFVYPAIIALGWYTVRTSERTERDFLHLVRRR